MDAHDPVTFLASAIRRRDLSPVELLESCLARIDEVNPTVNAVIWRNDDQAMDDARHLAQSIARGADQLAPFAGIPLPIKDLTPVAGWPVTYGSQGAPEGPSGQDELVIAAFRRAGFILCGRTNTPELGPLTAAENVRYGVSRNPFDLDRSPGGSSGGAAAAVASSMFPLAHGNDGGGSIRIPASCCGLVGLKVARGRVPALVPGWLGAVTEGVLTRTVADSAAVLDAICGPDPLCWINAPAPDRPFAAEVGADPGRLRVALCTRAPLGLPVAEPVRRAVVEAGRILEGLGHYVEERDVELFPIEDLGGFLHLVNAGLGDYVRLGVDFTKVEPHNAAAYAQAQSVSSTELVADLGRLQGANRHLLARWGTEFDLLVTPTMAIEPPAAGAILAQAQTNPGNLPPEVFAMAAFTAPFNVSGQPAISLPLGWSEAGLPIGVQLVGGPWQESVLIRVASQIEQATPWSDRRPRAA
jgi:amidase